MGLSVLRLSGGQVESLFDLGLPAEVAELPADLAALDGLLAAPGVLAPIEASWADGAVGFGRPTVPMDRFVRLMIVKARSGWGYETLAREVSDSLHLRRFRWLGLWDRVPDESTVRKLGSRRTPPARSRASPAGRAGWLGPGRRASAIAHARSPAGCAGSTARSRRGPVTANCWRCG